MGEKSKFWENKLLSELTRAEWESLCDGCARCCLIKFQNDETDELFYTNVVCELLDLETCQCTRYGERSRLVPTCLTLTASSIEEIHWMPRTCAYRLLSQGKPLPKWHPLVSGKQDSVHKSGVSVRGKVISQAGIPEEQLEDYIIEDMDL